MDGITSPRLQKLLMGGMTKSPPLQPKLLDGDIALIHFWILKRIAGHINAARKRAALLIH